MKYLLVLGLCLLSFSVFSLEKGELNKNIQMLLTNDNKQRIKAENFFNNLSWIEKKTVLLKIRGSINDFGGKAPLLIDDYTKLISMSASKDDISIIYQVNIDKLKPESDRFNEIYTYLKNNLINNQCIDESLVLFMVFGNTVTTEYKYSFDSSDLFSIVVDWTDCKVRS